MKLAICSMTLAIFVVAIGCEGNISRSPQTAEMASGAPAPPAPAPPGDPSQAAEAQKAERATATNPQAPAQDATEPAGNDSGTAEVAKAGVGVKGRDYGGAGFITTPIQQYFRIGERINFIQMDNSMKIYKAGHDNKGPKTQEEFMDVIIKENGVQLPDLPAGDEYFYDPKTAQLMVKHPVK